jgi:hypothetical protein
MRTSVKFLAVFLLACAWGGAHAQTCATGAPGVAPQATLTFAAITTNSDGTPIAAPVTYNLYQGASATTLAKVATALVPGANTVKTGLTANSTAYFAVSVSDALGTEGPQSNVACKSFPKSVPGTVTITIT